MSMTTHVVNVEVLTPVHIGTGESVDAFDYLRDQNMLYVVHPERWIRWLQQQNAVERWAQWGEDALQTQQQDNRITLRLNDFIQQRLRMSNLLQTAQAVKAYALRIEHSGEPLCDFRAHIRDAQYRAYLPGSSLKGAIRTAILEHLLLEEGQLQRLIVQPLGRVQSTDRYKVRREVRGVSGQMERTLLRGGGQKANNDLLRFLLVSDSEPFPHDQVTLRNVQVVGSSRQVKTWLEALCEGACTRFTLTFEPDVPNSQAQHLKIDRALLDYLRVEELFALLAERARAQLERELKYPSNPPGVENHLRALLERNSKEAPLLRVGWGQGYLGVTVMGALLEENRRAYVSTVSRLRPVLERRGRHILPERFPKTRRVVRSSKGQDVVPMGWVQLRLKG